MNICTVQGSGKFEKEGVRSRLFFLSFWGVLLRSFITAYDVAKMNTCVLGL